MAPHDVPPVEPTLDVATPPVNDVHALQLPPAQPAEGPAPNAQAALPASADDPVSRTEASTARLPSLSPPHCQPAASANADPPLSPTARRAHLARNASRAQIAAATVNGSGASAADMDITAPVQGQDAAERALLKLGLHVQTRKETAPDARNRQELNIYQLAPPSPKPP